MMRDWKAQRAGGSWLLDRLALIERLSAILAGREYQA